MANTAYNPESGLVTLTINESDANVLAAILGAVSDGTESRTMFNLYGMLSSDGFDGEGIEFEFIPNEEYEEDPLTEPEYTILITEAD